MTPPADVETLHAGCVAIGGHGLLLFGRPGSGKSDLALRLIDRGARLVSDDYTLVRREGTRLIASAPPTIAGMIEVRGLGIVEMPALDVVEVVLAVDLNQTVERMPPEQPPIHEYAGVALPVLAIAAFESSAPIKIEIAMRPPAAATED